jgi:hypothetical protein
MPVILDQWGRAVTISHQLAQFAYEASTGPDEDEFAIGEELISPAAHRGARAEALSDGYREGHAEGVRLGKQAELARFKEIARLCRGRPQHLEPAAQVALEFPDITAQGCVDMASRHFTQPSRMNASLAMRDTLPDSLAQAQAYWAAHDAARGQR